MNMRGKEYHAVVYSEYSGDTVIDEQDRCLIDKVHKEGLGNWNCTGNWLEFENLKFKNKGKEKLLKIIVKNKETGEQKCINIPKERENDSDVKALKVGMTVNYLEKVGYFPELVEVVKIVDDRPKAKGTVFDYIMPIHWHNMGDVRSMYPRRAGRNFSQKFWDDIKKMREERKELEEAKKEYQERPYFNVKLDPIKGQSDGKENLEKMKFPCWCVYKYREDGKHRIGMLVTGFPKSTLEYQLIDMMETVDAKNCCTLYRDTSLEKLMKKCHIEIVKGEAQLWKVGQFDI